MSVKGSISLCVTLVIAGWIVGHYDGKRAADRWYAHSVVFQGSTTTPIVSTPPPSSEMEALRLNDQSGTIVSIAMDGKVTFGKGFTPDKASKVFWNKLGQQWSLRCRDEQVKLIPPIKVRTAAPVANIEEHDILPQPHAPVILYNLEHDGLCKWGYVDDLREGHTYDAPCRVASVEEPR